MADDNSVVDGAEGGNEAPEGDSGIKNFKAEVNRKLENLNSQITKENQEMRSTIEKLVANIANKQEAGVSTAKDEQKLGELLYSDADAAASIIEERATRKAEARVNQQMADNHSKQATLASLTREYPELAENESELTKKSIEIFKSLSPTLQNSADGYEVAVRKAAAHVGVLPSDKRSKKSEHSDEYVTPGSTSTGRPSNRGGNKDVDQAIIETAKAFGLDVTNKKTMEGLKKRSQRTNWGKFE